MNERNVKANIQNCAMAMKFNVDCEIIMCLQEKKNMNVRNVKQIIARMSP